MMADTTIVELRGLTASFFPQTKQLFTSCTFAAVNLFGPCQDWEVWGTFTSRLEAHAAGALWATMFKGTATMTTVDGAYRMWVPIAPLMRAVSTTQDDHESPGCANGAMRQRAL